MPRNTLSNKGSRKQGRRPGDKGTRAASVANKPLVLALGGFTILAVALITLFAVMSAGGGDAESFTANDQGLIQPGQTAPSFTTETVDGGSVSLDGGQEATMLVFFATWCPACQAEAPTIADLSREYEGLEVVMVSVADEQWPETDTPEEVGEFVNDYGIEGPAVYDPDLAREYEVSGTPTVYVLDGEGEVVGAHAGRAPRGVFEGWIEEALA